MLVLQHEMHETGRDFRPAHEEAPLKVLRGAVEVLLKILQRSFLREEGKLGEGLELGRACFADCGLKLSDIDAEFSSCTRGIALISCMTTQRG